MTDDAGHARIGDDRRGEHRVGRREQRAEQEATRVQPRPDEPVRERSRRSAAVIGMPIASLRSGSCHSRWSSPASTSSPSRNRITIRATLARSATKPGVRLELEHPQPALAEHEAGEHEHGRQRQHASPRQARQQRAEHQQAAENRCDRLEGGHCGSVPHGLHVRRTRSPEGLHRHGARRGQDLPHAAGGRAEADSGRDVVIGYLEPHGRAETLAQAEGLEIVPRRRDRSTAARRSRRWTCRRCSRARPSCA